MGLSERAEQCGTWQRHISAHLHFRLKRGQREWCQPGPLVTDNSRPLTLQLRRHLSIQRGSPSLSAQPSVTGPTTLDARSKVAVVVPTKPALSAVTLRIVADACPSDVQPRLEHGAHGVSRSMNQYEFLST